MYQKGFGVSFPVYRTYYPSPQRGAGFGGLFRTLAKHATPFLKSAGKKALLAGTDIIHDMLVNKTPFKSAVKKGAKKAMSGAVGKKRKNVVGKRGKRVGKNKPFQGAGFGKRVIKKKPIYKGKRSGSSLSLKKRKRPRSQKISL